MVTRSPVQLPRPPGLLLDDITSPDRCADIARGRSKRCRPLAEHLWLLDLPLVPHGRSGAEPLYLDLHVDEYDPGNGRLWRRFSLVYLGVVRLCAVAPIGLTQPAATGRAWAMGMASETITSAVSALVGTGITGAIVWWINHQRSKKEGHAGEYDFDIRARNDLYGAFGAHLTRLETALQAERDRGNRQDNALLECHQKMIECEEKNERLESVVQQLRARVSVLERAIPDNGSNTTRF